jgi:hypothetical protein
MADTDINIDHDADIGANKVSIGKIFNTFTTSFMFAGFIIIMGCVGEVSRNSLWGLMVGYIFIITGMLMFTSNVIQKLTKSTNIAAKSLFSTMVTIGPLVVFMLILGSLIYLVGKHFEIIANGQVSASFSGMMNLMTIIIALTLYLINKATTTKEYIKTQSIDEVMGMSIYFTNLISIIILKTIYIILTFYTTDGFTTGLLV